MSAGPVSRDQGRDEGPARYSREPVRDPQQDETVGWRSLPAQPDLTPDDDQARLASLQDEPEPPDPDLDWYLDPDSGPPPGTDGSPPGDLIAECDEISTDQAWAAARAARLGTTGALAAAAAALGRRGPGQPGPAHRFPGAYSGPAAGFATGMPLDTAPGCAALAAFAEDAAGEDDAYRGVSDDELTGVLCAWDRVEAHAAARKHAAVAELIRRRPRAGYPVDPGSRMPAAWEEFCPDELSQALAQSRWAAGEMLD